MKVIKILFIISMSAILTSGCSENNSAMVSTAEVMKDNTQYTTFAEVSTLFTPEPTQISPTLDAIQKIDERKLWIRENRDKFSNEEGELYRDYRDENNLVCRNFYLNADKEPQDGTFTGFYLYYDEEGKIIYGEVGHYRSTVFNVYFQNDEILHIDFEPIKGELAYILATIEESKEYSFILDDISICLENAYK